MVRLSIEVLREDPLTEGLNATSSQGCHQNRRWAAKSVHRGMLTSLTG